MSASKRHMERALTLAARGRTSPNPQVGAVVVKKERIVAEGFHPRCGGPHAEVVALDNAGDRARGSDLYVTLEPCNHHGRTPPCTEAVIRAGIARVFVGFEDPDPDVAGGGAARLREAGIDVTVGMLRARCERFYEAYSIHRNHSRPHVTLKAGMTLDGKIATRTGHSSWVTGPEARRAVHRIRDRVDAIMIGVGTVQSDDPQLTTRLPRGRGHDPVRVIVDSRAKTPRLAKVIRHESDAETIIAHTAAGRDAASALERPGVIPLQCRTVDGRVDLVDLLRRLAGRGIVSLLAEGGGELHWSLIEARLVDRVKLFIAPIIVGGSRAVPVVGGQGVAAMNDAVRIDEMKSRRIGRDLFVEGRPHWPSALLGAGSQQQRTDED